MEKWFASVVLDDAIRMIIAEEEFDAATTQNSILMLDFAYQRSLTYGKIREVITDHGSQFYANRRDVERWFQIYKQFREEFASLEEMLVWYNTIRPHQSS